MGRLRRLSGREVCSILAKHGFVEKRQKGSHVVMQRVVGDSTISVPVPLHPEVRIGTLLSIIRQAGVPRTEFES
ncbi:MAG TPA: type II toxin-antitoxin system HicA family toxin [Pyrinomonadaceae bacterium]